jgi:hypothetical protein
MWNYCGGCWKVRNAVMPAQAGIHETVKATFREPIPGAEKL